MVHFIILCKGTGVSSPVLPDPLVLPLVLPRVRPPVSRGKVARQQVEVDARRRHDGTESRQGAHGAGAPSPVHSAPVPRLFDLQNGLRGAWV